jgi:hypothetical protein
MMREMVQLGGRVIPLRQSARDLGMAPSYLSKVLSGKRDIESVRVGLVQQMAVLFGFETMEDFLHAVKARRDALGCGVSPDVSDEPGVTVTTSHRDPLSSLV